MVIQINTNLVAIPRFSNYVKIVLYFHLFSHYLFSFSEKHLHWVRQFKTQRTEICIQE